jgi:dTDP-4-amino-4,6-dideoxygalactose transaminase
LATASKLRRKTESLTADLFGYDFGVLFGRGRSALTALLETVGNKKDTPFLLPSNICPSVTAAGVAAKTKIVSVPVDGTTGLPSDMSFCKAMGKFPTSGVVMLTHLYGFHGEYKKTLALAKKNGWFVLENDTAAVTARASAQDKKLAVGDALLVSFGAGKVLDGGAGGALLSDDGGLVKSLCKQAADYPLLDETAEATEAQLMMVRRLLRKDPVGTQNMIALYENFLPYEISGTRFALPETFDAQILSAVSRVAEEREKRCNHVEEWRLAMVHAGADVICSPLAQPSPWRFVARLKKHRNDVVAALRMADVDVGTNYPPVQEFFPRTFGSVVQESSRSWGAQVFNLWLTPDYGMVRKKEVAAKIAATLAKCRI